MELFTSNLMEFLSGLEPYFLIFITIGAVTLLYFRPNGFYKRAVIGMYEDNRVGAVIRSVLFLGSALIVVFSRYSLLREELPIVELVFSGFASTALVAFFTPSFKKNMEQGDFEGYWEYTNHPAKPNFQTSKDDSDWGQNLNKKRHVRIYYDNGDLKMDTCLEGTSEEYFQVTKAHTFGFGKLKGIVVYHYTSPNYVNDFKRGYVVLDWSRKDVCSPVEKMSGRFYNDTDTCMGEVKWVRAHNATEELTDATSAGET